MVDYQDRIEQMLNNGATFEQVEDYVNALPLDDPRKAALWLYAALLGPEPARRQIAREQLALADSIPVG